MPTNARAHTCRVAHHHSPPAEPDEMEQRLNTTIAIFGKLRGTYLEIKSETEALANPWGVQASCWPPDPQSCIVRIRVLGSYCVGFHELE